MADLNQISMKRKRLSLPITRSSIGSFGRSKSQVQSSRNHYDLHPFVKKLKNTSPAEDSPMGDDFSAVSIKYLRSRWVFSPSSTDGAIPNSYDDAENQIAGVRSGGIQESSENGGFRKLDVSNEDFVQSTPPDAEIFGGEPVVERNGTVFSDQFLEKKQRERNSFDYSMKPVLKPCSRVRLFKTPGSFSYRRLLPYLTDIEKYNSGSQIMDQCEKSGKGFKDHRLSASNGPETLPDKSTSWSLEVNSTDSGNSLITTSVESFTSKEIESSSMPLVNGEIKKVELQAACEDHNCSKNGSFSTIEDSHCIMENLAGVVSSDETLTGNGELAIEYPCNARSLEVLDQTLSTPNDKCESIHTEVPESSKDDTKKSEIQGMPNATVCHSLECQRLNSVDPALSENGGNIKCSLQQQRVDNDNEVVECAEDLNGEFMSMTPPDSVMSSKYEIDDSRGKTVDYVSQGIDQAILKSTNETFCRNIGQDCDISPDSSPKNNIVPNPHLHLKLSKIPVSFSYRRLLPYLLNITSHNSSASGNIRSLKDEKSFKEKLVSPFFTSGKETCTETLDNKSCPVEHHPDDDIELPVVAATSTSSSNNKLTQSPPKQVAESPMIMDSWQEPTPIVKPSASDTSQKVESRPKDVVESIAMSSSSLISSSLLPREGDAKSAAPQLPLETEEDSIKSTEKYANREKQIQADSFAEASMPPGIPSASLLKGILKRNPRGCRGICTCLNCSSFLLHAERSFEFSRNQMQDAEEVTLDLIKEISHLRNLLEKSAFVAKDQTNICINQVRKACKKASDAEELAKARLSEMNYHLNIHCRIPCKLRPSVKFADKVEEHYIRPISDSSNKLSL